MTEEAKPESHPVSATPIRPSTVIDAPRSMTPMELLGRALDRGDDLTVLEKLMDLQERHEKNQARKAFDAAVADAKAELPVISRNRTGNNSKKYADLGAFAEAVDPIIAKYGLNYRFRSRQEGGLIHVTCVLSHRDGHSEETTLGGGADKTGNKNDIQALGSTLTYLQRYSLKLALGLADGEGDDDGRAAGGDEPISAEQLEGIRKKIEESGADIAKFCELLKVEALPDIRKSQHSTAIGLLDAKIKKAAKKEPSK